MEARVSDFGLATLMEPDKTHVSTFVAGTFGYLAPGWYTTDRFKYINQNLDCISILFMFVFVINRVFRYWKSDNERRCLQFRSCSVGAFNWKKTNR